MSELGEVQMAATGSASKVADDGTAVLARVFAPSLERLLMIGGIACFAIAIALGGAYLYAFEAVIAAAAAFVSADGVVEEANRRALSAILLFAIALAALTGASMLALAVPAWRSWAGVLVAWDPLGVLGLRVPNAYLMQTFSLTLGALVIAMHLAGQRLGGALGPMFQKEGPFELLTALLELAAAGWCIAAAYGWKRRMNFLTRVVPMLYVVLATALFLVAMEEINWGQTLLGFETPETWAAINYQQQTSLHNLIPAPTLEFAERVLVVTFTIGAFVLMALARRFERSLFAAIAPPASLATLALLCAVPGVFLRLEVTELLLALFFAFYAYRLYAATRARTATAAG
jgi:hypothetical protein